MNTSFPDTLIFLHMGKTGGSTFGHILSSNFSHDTIFNGNVGDTNSALGLRYFEEIKLAYEALSDEKRKNIKLIDGHVPFGIHEIINDNSKYITILRNPVDRVVSSFYYIHNIKTLPIYNSIKNMSLNNYIDSHLGLDSYNYQVRILSGDPDLNMDWSIEGPINSTPVTSTHLEMAKSNIEKYFLVAGTLEHFNDLVIYMKRMYKWKIEGILFTKKNKTTSRKTLDQLSPHIIEKIIHNNRFDMELYDWVKIRFLSQLEKQGFGFKCEKIIFDYLNKSYNENNDSVTFNLAKSIVNMTFR